MSAPAASAASSGAPGLVSCTTKFTRSDSDLVIETASLRTRKLGRAVMHAASLHEAACIAQFGVCAPIFVTMTYAADVKPAAQDVRQLWARVREWFRRQVRDYPRASRPRFRFLWVAELTKKGRVHYHAVLFLPPSMRLPMFDRCGWWPHGMTRIERVAPGSGASVVGYCAKYISKATNGRSFPKGLRLHGCGGLTKAEASAKRYHTAPEWVREYFDKDEQPRPLPGGGWWSRISGHIQSSPFYIVSAAAGRVVVRVYKWYRDHHSISSLHKERIPNDQTDYDEAARLYLSLRYGGDAVAP